MNEETMTAPPLGLRPRFAYIEPRLDEIEAAILRYTKARIEIPISWVEEHNSLVALLHS